MRKTVIRQSGGLETPGAAPGCSTTLRIEVSTAFLDLFEAFQSLPVTRRIAANKNLEAVRTKIRELAREKFGGEVLMYSYDTLAQMLGMEDEYRAAREGRNASATFNSF